MMESFLYPMQELQRRALAWAVKLRVNPSVIRVQDMRRKWGSCSLAGTVTLARDLVHQDQCFQHFVIAHELLHNSKPPAKKEAGKRPPATTSRAKKPPAKKAPKQAAPKTAQRGLRKS